MTVAPLRRVAESAKGRLTVWAATLIAYLCFGLNALTLGQDQPASQWTMTNTAVSVDMSQDRQAIQMVENTSREITANRVFKRINVQNSNIIEAKPLEGGNRLLISAKATGVTQIDLRAADDTVHTIEVLVLGDVRSLEAILRHQFPDSNLTVIPVQQGCIISGYVTADEDVAYIAQIAQQYFPTVINKVRVTGVHTVQLQVQIMEISRTKLRELGIDWAFANGDDVVSSTVGGILSVTGTSFVPTGSETMTVGIVEKGTSFFSAIRALKRENLVKVLASPTLVAVDGRPASFNSGGEIPIIVPAGLGQVGIEFREFGTRLDFVAKVKRQGQIELEVRPYVSEIDPTRSVTLNGITVPGLRSRFLETGVVLGAGQTLALGGLLQVRTEAITTGLPVLSDMPFVGTFFRSVREEQNEIELLITVTPQFAGPMNPHEVPAAVPGSSSQSPTDRELYMKAFLETPVTGGMEGVPISPVGPPPMGSPGLIEHLPAGATLVPAGGFTGANSQPTNVMPASTYVPPPATSSNYGNYGANRTPASNAASYQRNQQYAPVVTPSGLAQPNGSYGATNQNGGYPGTRTANRQQNLQATPGAQPTFYPPTGAQQPAGSYYR